METSATVQWYHDHVAIPELSESCDGWRPLLHRWLFEQVHGQVAFRILRRMETSATPLAL